MTILFRRYGDATQIRWGLGIIGLLWIVSPGTHSAIFAQDRFFEEWLEPIHHTHFSESGTPFVHPFNFEPPQIHQDAFFIYKYTDNTLEGSSEYETEAHLDWALTKRLGFVLGVPLVGVQDANGVHSVGAGDLEIAPRATLIHHERFILASNTMITIPTGDATRDLGSGEVVISPYVTTWHDLGNWNTLMLNVGPSVGLDTGTTSITYACSLTHTWLGPQLLTGDHDVEHRHEDGHQHHFPPGMTTFYLEMTGESELGGDKLTFIELMPGVSYVLTEHAEIRLGTLLPISKTQRFDAQVFTSFTWIY